MVNSALEKDLKSSPFDWLWLAKITVPCSFLNDDLGDREAARYACSDGHETAGKSAASAAGG